MLKNSGDRDSFNSSLKQRSEIVRQNIKFIPELAESEELDYIVGLDSGKSSKMKFIKYDEVAES